MPCGDPRMVEVAGLVVGHADPLHHPLGRLVGRRRERQHLLQPGRTERVRQRGPRSLGRITLAPGILRQPPADLDTGQERRLEGWHRQPDEADELPGLPDLGRPESEAALLDHRVDPLDQRVAVLPAQRGREVFHYGRVRVQRGARLVIAVLRRAQQQAFGGQFSHFTPHLPQQGSC
jgi:hypothetical protein